jgi:hypothetical protein
MSKKAKFYGEVKGGKLLLDRPELYQAFIPTLEGLRIELTLEKESEDITKNQWAYLFAVLYPAIALETGYTVEEVDGMLKKRHLTVNRSLKNEYVKDKSSLNREQLAQYIDLCLLDAANLGIIVPPPDKNWRLKNETK